MSGYGWGSHPGQSALEVAKAFYEGRPCKRTNCRTDGQSYWLYDNVIAQRVSFAHRVANKLTDTYDQQTTMIERNAVQSVRVRWAGYTTQTTARHLSALGFPADQGRGNLRGRNARYYEPPTICGVAVRASEWYEIEQLLHMPLWHRPEPPPKKPHWIRRRKESFVNLTLPLFPETK